MTTKRRGSSKVPHVQSGIQPDMAVAARYGSDAEVFALAQRIMDVHSQAELMRTEGCVYMAQMSIISGARALPEELGEIRVWEEDGELVFYFGYQYHERVMESKGGGYFWPQARQMTPDERQQYEVLDGDLAYICRLVRMSDLQQLTSMGLPASQVIDNAAFVGVGVIMEEEMIQKKPPKGRTWAWLGMQRCEKDAMSKAFGTSAQPMHLGQVDAAAGDVLTAHERMSLEETNDLLFG